MNLRLYTTIGEQPTKTVILTLGLPASGKSFWSKNYCANNKHYTRINQDSIRLMHGVEGFDRKRENLVFKQKLALLKCALDNGWGVIIDDTNLNPKTRNRILEFLEKEIGDVEVFIADFTDETIETCITRNEGRSGSDYIPPDVIYKMYYEYVVPNK